VQFVRPRYEYHTNREILLEASGDFEERNTGKLSMCLVLLLEHRQSHDINGKGEVKLSLCLSK